MLDDSLNSDQNMNRIEMQKGQQHPKDFPGGHPPQYYPGLARLNFGVRMGSGAFNAVWPLTIYRLSSYATSFPLHAQPIPVPDERKTSNSVKPTNSPNRGPKKAISVALIGPDSIPLSLIGYGTLLGYENLRRANFT